uniref:Fucosyltransferase n=2 Tax=Caenorhabditis tropicalis TaxID=1561998 RepID=A0A1I7UDM4_9PELO
MSYIHKPLLRPKSSEMGYKSPLQSGNSMCTWRYLGRFVTLGVYAAVALFLWYTLVPTRSKEPISANLDASAAPVITKNVVIYAATKFFGHPITTERFLATCPDVQNYCRITQDESEFDNADAVLFHNADYHGQNEKFKSMKNQRKPGVPFVLWSLESPSNDNFRPETHMINWTMTYRTDADIWAPYGTMIKRHKALDVNLHALWNSKSKSATWLASNCFTQNKRPYKFYLSIENSNCKDYVTEKFWKALNDRVTIPIVLARKYYKDLGVPDSAYIAIDDYATFDEFVAHVKRVEKDKDLYLSYHEWRKDWKVIIGSGFSGWCTLCDKLQDKEYILKHPKSYKDVAWWHSFEMCNNQIANKFL